MTKIYYSEREQSKITKGKRHTPRGNQPQASKSPLPVRSNRMHLNPPALNCDNLREVLPTRKTHQRHGIQGLYWKLVTDTLCLAHTKFQTQKKAGVHYISHCLYS